MNIRTLMNCESLQLFEKKKSTKNLVKNGVSQLLKMPGVGYSRNMISITRILGSQTMAQKAQMLKRLVEYKERQIDSIVLYLNYMQGNDISEIMQGNDISEIVRGFCAENEITLLSRFNFAKLDPENLVVPQKVCHPDKVIELLKGEISAICSNTNDLSETPNAEGSVESDTVNISNQPDDHKADAHQTTLNEGKSDEDNLNELPCYGNKPDSKPLSQHSLAVRAINDNGIVLVPKMQAFLVKGSKGNKYSVTLFPKETCNCAATSRCCHIITAMMLIGMPISTDKKKINLSKLRWNMRPMYNKKCGTKKGRVGDTDEDAIIAAPDSTIKVNESLLLKNAKQ